MKESYWGYWLVILGIFIIVVMMLTQDATTISSQDYYQLKEAAFKNNNKLNILIYVFEIYKLLYKEE